MAARLTDRQKKKIIADFVELGSYSAAAKKNKVNPKTVKRIVATDSGTREKVERKKEQNTKAILEHMDGKKELVCQIIDKGLAVLNSQEKLDGATPAQIATAIGKLIDVFAAGEGSAAPREASKGFDIPARLLASAYGDVHRDVINKRHRRYLLKGGRGSAKSSYISLEIICLLENNPQLHAVVLRKVGNTLRGSVYSQLLWAIEAMGLTDRYTAKLTPLEITKKETGQTIRFFGLDDAAKLKSIKPAEGYNGILWAEEIDQFAGFEELRNAEQSILRGGDEAYIFGSFNPPKTRNNWANEDAELKREDRLVVHTDYRGVPPEWLGQNFLDEAEYLKKINPAAYEHEYLGIPNGNGGMVFENLAAETVTDEEIRRFDRCLCGVDWGYYPDPWAFNRVYYDAARRTLTIYQELTAYKKGNRATADMLLEAGVKEDELITADSAEMKSVADYRSYGLNCYGAKKGPGSVDYSMKWLQSLVKIVIDPERCPDTYKEFARYEYERTKDGEIISGYPDRDNHHIDAVRYATEEIWKWKGE